jgi:hypothetical protein
MGETTHGQVQGWKRQIYPQVVTQYYNMLQYLPLRDAIVSRLWLNTGRIARFGESGSTMARRMGNCPVSWHQNELRQACRNPEKRFNKI